MTSLLSGVIEKLTELAVTPVQSQASSKMSPRLGSAPNWPKSAPRALGVDIESDGMSVS